FAFIWQLGSTGLIDETEPFFGEEAGKRRVTGDGITPYLNGETGFNKPPLIYWLMAIAYNILGVNAWAARLPSAISAIALTVGIFLILRYFGYTTPKAAKSPTFPVKQLGLAATIGATLNAFNFQTIAWARTGVSDMLLSACMGLSLISFFWGYAIAEKRNSPEIFNQKEQPKPPADWQAETNSIKSATAESQEKDRQANSNKYSWLSIPNKGYLGFYIFAGLAVLAKGPVGIVIPGLTLIIFSLYFGKFWELLREVGVIIGGAIFFLITIPWYVLVILANGQTYIDSFFGYHNFERFTGVVNNHAAPWYFYFLVVFVGFLPWSVYLPLAIARLRFWKRSHWQQQPRRSHLGIFALAWFVAIFGFFTVAVTKLPSYTLPLLPATAILVALFWSDELTRDLEKSPSHLDFKHNWGRLMSGGLNLIIAIAMTIAIFISPQLIGYDPVAPNFGELFAATGLQWRGAMVWGLASIAIALLLWRKKTWRWLLPVNLIAFTLFLAIVLTPALDFIDRVRQEPIRDLATIILQEQQPNEPIFMMGFKKPTLVFYTQKPVRYVYAQDDTQASLTQNPPSSDTVLMVGQPTGITNAFNLQPDEYQDLGQKGAYQLVRIEVDRLLQ
ncbi:MAG: glycosyltransferase family 39 protein, partial [Jaaginema sp. PMC 1079.18]|nr:glycosyltransferase family 39 protein [Jaaginema sp. PMC 1079.18]